MDITWVRSVDCDAGRRILIHVVDNLPRLVAVGTLDIVTITGEGKVPVEKGLKISFEV